MAEAVELLMNDPDTDGIIMIRNDDEKAIRNTLKAMRERGEPIRGLRNENYCLGGNHNTVTSSDAIDHFIKDDPDTAEAFKYMRYRVLKWPVPIEDVTAEALEKVATAMYNVSFKNVLIKLIRLACHPFETKNYGVDSCFKVNHLNAIFLS